MQGYCSGRSVDVRVMSSRIERSVSDVSDWCAAKRLQLNADKTEVLWFGPPSQLRQLSSVSSAITITSSRRRQSSVIWASCLTLSCQCASTSRVCHRRASFICAAYAQFFVNSVATSLPSWLQLWCCRALTIATLFLWVSRR